MLSQDGEGVDVSAHSEKHLSVEDLAEREGVPVQTIYGWHKTGDGPPRMKIGRYVRYRLADVEKWEQARIVGARTA